MRNALLTACAYLALLALAPPAASAQKRPYVAPPLVPMAQLQALAVTLSQHSDTTIQCDGPASFAAMLAKDNSTPGKGVIVYGFVEYGPDGQFIDVIHLPTIMCQSMQRVRRNDANAGSALAALIHESMHLRLASGDEGTVECTAYANRWQVVEPWHLPARIAREVMHGIDWFHSQTLPEYRVGCPSDIVTASSIG